MKSLLSVCIIAASALLAGNTISGPSRSAIPKDTPFFTCDIDGKSFTATSNDSNTLSLTTTFTYADAKHIAPAAVFINAEQQEGNVKTSFFIQPINDDAPAAALKTNSNLYQQFFIVYRAADGCAYNTTTAPGNLEIIAIDTTHKLLTGKLNCILYSSAKKDWLLVTNGRFRLKF